MLSRPRTEFGQGKCGLCPAADIAASHVIGRTAPPRLEAGERASGPPPRREAVEAGWGWGGFVPEVKRLGGASSPASEVNMIGRAAAASASSLLVEPAAAGASEMGTDIHLLLLLQATSVSGAFLAAAGLCPVHRPRRSS